MLELVVVGTVLLGAVDALEAPVLLLLAVLINAVAALDELVASVAPVDCVEDVCDESVDCDTVDDVLGATVETVDCDALVASVELLLDVLVLNGLSRPFLT